MRTPRVHINDQSPVEPETDEDILEKERVSLQNIREALIQCLAVQKVPFSYFRAKPERLELLYNTVEKDLGIPRNTLTENGWRSFMIRQIGQYFNIVPD